MDRGASASGETLPGSRAGGLGSQRDLVLLGSTGSIGTQAADIVRRNPDRFRLVALAAGGGNPELLASQAIEFGVEVVAVASEGAVPGVHDAVQAKAANAGQRPRCWRARLPWPRSPPGSATSC